MVTDKGMGVQSQHDEWLRGEKQASSTLDMSLSKALNPSFAWLNDVC